MAVCFPRCVRIFGYGFSKVRAVHERRGNADFKRRGGRWGTVWYVGALGKNIRKITEYTRSRLKEDAMPIQLIISLVPLYDEPGSFRPVAPRAASLVPLPLYGESGSLRPVAPRAASLVPFPLYGEPGSLRPVAPRAASLVPLPLYGESGSLRPVAPRAASLVPFPLYGEPGSLRPVAPRAASLVPFPLYGEPGSLRPVAPRAASLVPLPLYGESGSLRPVRPFKAFADTVSFISVYEGLPVGPQIFCGGKIPGRAGGFLLGRAGLSEFYAFLT